jgi:hypothetical protein
MQLMTLRILPTLLNNNISFIHVLGINKGSRLALGQNGPFLPKHRQKSKIHWSSTPGICEYSLK